MTAQNPPAGAPNSPEAGLGGLRVELANTLAWCLGLGGVAGVLLGAVLLTTGPVPGYLPGALTFIMLWGLLGMSAGLVAAGVRLLRG